MPAFALALVSLAFSH